ncbi:MAG: outer membrane beta-barrel protein, partial [Proteobacteria bacterium]|nr:outer membrane beta-barrel protein [Pseudomonadota bacterium]
VKYNLDTQRPGAPELTTGVPATVEGRPLVHAFGASSGVTQSFGRLEAGLRGTVDRTSYENARLSDGSTLDLKSDSYNTYGVRGRLGYEVTPGVKPFVEAGVDTRKHDRRVDASGYARDSDGVTGKVGTTIEVARLITGEVSAGYTSRRYEDGRLPNLRGPVFDASLVWQASPLTTITLKASTELAETNVAGASGAVSRKVSLDVAHALMRNLTIGGALSWQDTDYRGYSLTEKTMSGTLRAEYALTRSVALKGSFTHERLKSSSPGSDYTANVYLLGLRLQR